MSQFAGKTKGKAHPAVINVEEALRSPSQREGVKHSDDLERRISNCLKIPHSFPSGRRIEENILL
jgi:hypothetical protein